MERVEAEAIYEQGREVVVAVLLRMDEQIARLEKRVARQDERIARLEHEAKRSSRNSSRPPSEGPPTAPKRGRDPSGRKAGGQPGHEGRGRPLLPAWAVDEVIEHWPVDCGCGHVFGAADRVAAGAPARHQVEELPVMAVRVTEHRCQRVVCPGCGARRGGALPAEVAGSAFGPRLQAAVVTLSVRNRISRRDTVELCEQLFSSRISTGTVDAILTRTAAALSEPCEDLLERVRDAPALNMDETGWRLRGAQRALWGVFTDRHAVLRVEPDRHEDRARELLAGTKAIVTSDRWWAYSHLPVRRRQVCWSHLQRDFAFHAEGRGVEKELGEAGLRICDELFWAWEIFQHTGERAELKRRVRALQRELKPILREHAGTKARYRQGRRYARNVLKIWPALWTFAARPGVQPTNNHAERALRGAVIYRKLSLGSQSEDGERRIERLLSAHTTCRLQRRSLHAYPSTCSAPTPAATQHRCWPDPQQALNAYGLDIRSSDIAAISAEQATFRALVSVTDTHIAGHTNFRFSAFAAACRFRQVTFGGAARLRGIYEKDVLFDTCRFCGDAYFSGAEFKGFTAVQGGWFDRSALFDFARFERRARIEPESVKRRLVLAGANFHERSDVATLATVVDLQDTGFEAAVRLQLPSSVVVANGARFAEGSSLSGTPRQAAKKQSKAEGVHGEVSVASLRGADLAGLTLSHCDLTRCHLAGANGLDRLRLDEGYRLARSPGWPRWTPRQVLVEEHLWRARTHARNGWSAPPPWSAELVRLGIPQVPTTPLSPADIAGTYRALRKAQEDAKDAPGAGDLFYGEMEMRRKAARWFGPSSRAERPVLASYWLVAGYGLRASRALAALAVVIALGAAGFATYGFVDLNDPLGPQPSQQAGLSHRPIVRPAPRQLPRNPRDLGDALSHAAAWQFAVESALPLPTYSQPRLSREGRTIRIFLRILGPILLGLIVLCVRSRVKR